VRRTHALALAAAAATGVQVGAAMVATRYVVHDIGPASLALLRYAIGVLCLVPFLLFNARAHIGGRDLAAIMGLGIVQFGLLIALLNMGLRFISSARAALLFTTFPLLTMIVATALGRERLSAAKAIGVMTTMGGVGATLGDRLLAGAANDEWLGAAAVLAAALCGAVCAVLYRPYLTRYPTIQVSAIAMLASVVFLAGFAAAEGLFAHVPNLSLGGWLVVMFIGLSSGIGYLLWLWALKHASPTRVTVFLSLSPLTAAVFGTLWLGEPFTPGMFIGLAGVSVGLWIATRSPESVLSVASG
jgi:drug/metabolite transporter (DMT)-like permease